ncbi:MAG: hypothetical protein VB996_12970, partial [Pseudomonadales bacterium]
VGARKLTTWLTVLVRSVFIVHFMMHKRLKMLQTDGASRFGAWFCIDNPPQTPTMLEQIQHRFPSNFPFKITIHVEPDSNPGIASLFDH